MIERGQESGLEVQLPTNPEVAAPPYESRYTIGNEGSDHLYLDSPAQSHQADWHNMRHRGLTHLTNNEANRSGRQSQAKILSRSRAVWVLAAITVMCLVIALGA